MQCYDLNIKRFLHLKKTSLSRNAFRDVSDWVTQIYQILITVDFAETEIYFRIKHKNLTNGKFRKIHHQGLLMKASISPKYARPSAIWSRWFRRPSELPKLSEFQFSEFLGQLITYLESIESFRLFHLIVRNQVFQDVCYNLSGMALIISNFLISFHFISFLFI